MNACTLTADTQPGALPACFTPHPRQPATLPGTPLCRIAAPRSLLGCWHKPGYHPILTLSYLILFYHILIPRQLAGTTVFRDALMETKQAFAYALADAATGQLSHVIAWRWVGRGGASL